MRRSSCGVALVLASSAVGSYSITQGSDGGAVIFEKSGGDWETRGGALGALIGAGIGGVGGAGIGGLIGGAIGHAVDECTK